MTDTFTSLSTLQHLNFELTCDGYGEEDCNNVAHWCRISDCGCTKLFCNYCKGRSEGYVEALRNTPTIWYCKQCGEEPLDVDKSEWVNL